MDRSGSRWVVWDAGGSLLAPHKGSGSAVGMQHEEFRSQLVLDPKGRITLPVQLRTELAKHEVDRLVGIAARGGLWLFAPDDYRRIIKGRVRDADPFAPQTTSYLRAVVSTNATLPIDNNGRILLPPHLRELAGLDRDIVMFSSLDWIEVWDKTRWDDLFASALHDFGVTRDT